MQINKLDIVKSNIEDFVKFQCYLLAKCKDFKALQIIYKRFIIINNYLIVIVIFLF